MKLFLNLTIYENYLILNVQGTDVYSTNTTKKTLRQNIIKLINWEWEEVPDLNR